MVVLLERNEEDGKKVRSLASDISEVIATYLDKIIQSTYWRPREVRPRRPVSQKHKLGNR